MSEKPGCLPLWSRIIIGLVIAAFSGTMIFASKCVFDIKELARLAVDPAYIAMCAGKIADFPEPLPEGYSYKVGLDLQPFQISIVTLEHAADQQQMVFFSVRDQTPDVDAKSLLSRAYDYGINTPTASAHFTDLKMKGEITVAGETAPYMSGQLTDREGRKYEGLIACIRPKGQKKTILIYALEPPGKPLNTDICFDLLKKIKKI
ncbi:MAG TPA: hypothetical protein V6D17_17600 [Candidatus Obscuribacterales bacterium]